MRRLIGGNHCAGSRDRLLRLAGEEFETATAGLGVGTQPVPIRFLKER